LFEDDKLIRVHEDGSAYHSDAVSCNDILLIDEPKRIWVNVYITDAGITLDATPTHYRTEEDAKRIGKVHSLYLKTIEITDEI